MALKRTARGSSTNSLATLDSASFTPAVGSMVLAIAIGFDGDSDMAFSDTFGDSGGTAWNNDLGFADGDAQRYIRFSSRIIGTGPGAGVVTLSNPLEGDNILVIEEIDGEHGTPVVQTNSAVGGTGATQTVTLGSALQVGSLVYAAESSQVLATIPGVPAGFANVHGSSPAGDGFRVAVSTWLNSAVFTALNTSDNIAGIIEIKPATAPIIYQVADRGSLANLTSQTSVPVDMAAAGAITVGNYLVMRASANNSGTNGAAPTFAVADARNGSWTVLGPALNDPGLANAGVCTWIAYVKAASGYTNGDDVTITLGTATTAKAVVIEEWAGIHATVPEAVAATTATGASTTPSVARTPLAVDQLWYGANGAEGPHADAYTEDTDVVDGSWQTLTGLGSTDATAANNVKVTGAAKYVAGTTAQTWTPTITSRDWAAIALVFAPAAAAGGPVSLDGQGNIASVATGLLLREAVITGTGAIASGSISQALAAMDLAGMGTNAWEDQGQLLAAMYLTGQGNIASATSTIEMLLTAYLAGQGGNAVGGTGVLLAEMDLTGSGNVASGVNADLLVLADLTGSGAIASQALGELLAGLDLSGSGHIASAAASLELLVLQFIEGAGHSASGGIAELLLQGDLSGQGNIASQGLSALNLIADLTGHGDIATVTSGELLAALALLGHGDIAVGGRADLSVDAGEVVAVARLLHLGKQHVVRRSQGIRRPSIS